MNEVGVSMTHFFAYTTRIKMYTYKPIQVFHGKKDTKILWVLTVVVSFYLLLKYSMMNMVYSYNKIIKRKKVFE